MKIGKNAWATVIWVCLRVFTDKTDSVWTNKAFQCVVKIKQQQD